MVSIQVVGAGVSGLTTALVLQQADYKVEIIASETEFTTSHVAAAFWYPYLVAPKNRAAHWAGESLRRFRALSINPHTGVRMTVATIAFRRPEVSPEWAALFPDFRHAPNPSLPPEYCDAFKFVTPVIEMPKYMAYLRKQFESAGGNIRKTKLNDLSQTTTSVVVNCTGLGARQLVDDGELWPMRGQVVKVPKANIDTLFFAPAEDQDLVYIVPRSHDCVLGGTETPTDNRIVSEEDTRQIIANCQRVIGNEKLDTRDAVAFVGLRPCRKTVRLERDSLPLGKSVVHNYGHGGRGGNALVGLRSRGGSTCAASRRRHPRSVRKAYEKGWPKVKAHVEALQDISQLKTAIDANDLARMQALMTRYPSLHRAALDYGNNGPLT